MAPAAWTASFVGHGAGGCAAGAGFWRGPGMTEEKFEAILARQVPDAEKRHQADFIIDTSLGLEPARDRVREIVRQLRGGGIDGLTS